MTFSDEEMRIVALSGPMWLRMLRARETALFDKIYGEFRNGKTDHVATLAEFCCLRAQINELITALKLHDKGE